MSFNYEKAEVESLTNYGPYKIKIYDDAGNSTKWLTLDYDTFVAIREALISQGEKEADARKGLDQCAFMMTDCLAVVVPVADATAHDGSPDGTKSVKCRKTIENFPVGSTHSFT